MLDSYVERIEAENRELRGLLSLGDGWPDVMKKRQQGTADLADRLKAVGHEAEWELTGACQLPANCVLDLDMQREVDKTRGVTRPAGKLCTDTLTLVHPIWFDRDGKPNPTRVRHSFAPNHCMKPLNEAAQSIHEAWLRSLSQIDRNLFIRREPSIPVGVAGLAQPPSRWRSSFLSRTIGKGSAVAVASWRRVATRVRKDRRWWTLYDNPRSHCGRQKPLYIRLLTSV